MVTVKQYKCSLLFRMPCINLSSGNERKVTACDAGENIYNSYTSGHEDHFQLIFLNCILNNKSTIPHNLLILPTVEIFYSAPARVQIQYLLHLSTIATYSTTEAHFAIIGQDEICKAPYTEQRPKIEK